MATDIKAPYCEQSNLSLSLPGKSKSLPGKSKSWVAQDVLGMHSASQALSKLLCT